MAEPALGFGEPLARVEAASNRNPHFALESLGGCYVLFCAVTDPAAPAARAAIEAMAGYRFNEMSRLAAVFSAAGAPDDPMLARQVGRKLALVDRAALRACALIDAQSDPAGRWVLFDQSLRAMAFWPLDQAVAALETLKALPAPAPTPAPILIAPHVFEPEFCQELIAYYDARGGEPSGITLQNPQGQTYVHLDPAYKKRFDCIIEDAALREAAQTRIMRRLAPQIERAFMWRPTRIERYLVARYDDAEGGFFRRHRDNTTRGTAHRKFAVTINLNADGYEGGDLCFPEFGAQTYRASTGGAIVFACALMHEVARVTRGRRYAFLPFLFDEAGAQLRERNAKYLHKSAKR